MRYRSYLLFSVLVSCAFLAQGCGAPSLKPGEFDATETAQAREFEASEATEEARAQQAATAAARETDQAFLTQEAERDIGTLQAEAEMTAKAPAETEEVRTEAAPTMTSISTPAWLPDLQCQFSGQLSTCNGAPVSTVAAAPVDCLSLAPVNNPPAVVQPTAISFSSTAERMTVQVTVGELPDLFAAVRDAQLLYQVVLVVNDPSATLPTAPADAPASTVYGTSNSFGGLWFSLAPGGFIGTLETHVDNGQLASTQNPAGIEAKIEGNTASLTIPTAILPATTGTMAAYLSLDNKVCSYMLFNQNGAAIGFELRENGLHFLASSN
jgi:hypothetical protein